MRMKCGKIMRIYFGTNTLRAGFKYIYVCIERPPPCRLGGRVAIGIASKASGHRGAAMPRTTPGPAVTRHTAFLPTPKLTRWAGWMGSA